MKILDNFTSPCIASLLARRLIVLSSECTGRRPLSASLVNGHNSTMQFIVCGWSHEHLSSENRLKWASWTRVHNYRSADGPTHYLLLSTVHTQ